MKFVSGEDECVDEEYYKEHIEPYALVMPVQTYEFFKKTALKACAYAGSGMSNRCSHDVKTIDDLVRKLIDIQNKYSKMKRSK